MERYRAVIRPVASFSSQLQSDTLFGAFCWSYRYICGEDRLEALLEKMKTGEPAVIFSNAFPRGTLPLPLGIRDSAADFEKIESKTERRRAYQEHKKLKNAKFVRREWFDRIAAGDTCGFTEGLEAEEIREQAMIHNMVSRDDGTVRNIDGSGNLYEEDEFFMEEGCEYDVYIQSSLEESLIRQIVDTMFLLGIGKNKSTGKGAFEVTAWTKETDFVKSPNANAFLALSNFSPAHSDPIKGWYKTLVKYGRLDREYAASERPFKKPIVFFQAGAVFFDDPVREFYGRCVQNISAIEGVVVNAYTIAVPLYVKG